MLLLSPELAVMLAGYKGEDIIEFSFRALEGSTRRYFVRRLLRNLKNLELLGIIRIVYLSHRRVAIRVVGKRFFELLSRLLGSLNYSIDFEISDRSLKILNFIHTAPYTKDIEFFSVMLGISRRGARKIVDKLINFGLLDRELNLTQYGVELLDILRSTPHISRMLQYRINPFLCLKLIATVNDKVIDALVEEINSIIELNRERGLEIEDALVIGFDSDWRIAKLVKQISQKMRLPCAAVSVTIPEDKLFPLYASIGQMWGDVLLYGVEYLKEKIQEFKEISLLVKTLGTIFKGSRKKIIILLMPPQIAYIVDRMFREYCGKMPPVLIVLRVDEEFPYLYKDLREISITSERITSEFLNALGEKRRISIMWGEQYLKSSVVINVRDAVKEQAQIDVFSRIEDGAFRGCIMYIPIGEIRVSLAALARVADIHGEINLAGEPIIGLKPASQAWMRGEPTEAEARIKIVKDEDQRPRIHIEWTKYTWLRELDDCIIYELHIGLGKTKRVHLKEPISPLLTRTRKMIHFWILDLKNKTYYQLLIRGARIYADDMILWETEP